MIEATQGGSFREQDFLAILGNYSSYIEGELKDYLLIYMSDDDFADFRAFLRILQDIGNLTINSLLKHICLI